MAESNFKNLSTNMPSLCIPRVFPNITEFRIRTTIEELNLGQVDRIDMIERHTEKGEKFNQVFIHFKTWYDNTTAVKARNQLISGKEIKIIYDQPWFWKVSAYKKPSQHSKPRPQQQSLRPRAPASIVLDEETPVRRPQYQEDRRYERPEKQTRHQEQRPSQREYINRIASQCQPSSVEKENRRTVKQEIEEEEK